MTRRRLNFATLVTLLAVAFLTVTILLVVTATIRSQIAVTVESLSTNSEMTLSVVSRGLFDPLNSSDLSTVEAILNDLQDADTGIAYVAVRDADGQNQAEVIGTWSPNEQDSLELAAEALRSGEIQSREIDRHMFLSGPIAVGSERIGTLEIAFDQMPYRTLLGAARGTIIVLTVLVVSGATVSIFLVARRATAPLRDLTAAADEIGRGNLNVAVPVRGAQEMAALGVALERMRADLLALYRDLEQQVSSLERRARYQEATAAVARDVAAMLDVGKLLSRVVTLVSGQLGFYHTGIFLLDPTGEWAELRAASSEGGQRMLARGHRLRVAGEEIVGYVANRGEARVVLDVGEDAAYFDNPDLPETCSEVALPLRARGEILGVLDVQSKEHEAFTEEDVAVLQTLADQVATAISNARLFQQAQDALEAERRAYGEMSREAWAETLRGRDTVGYRCDADAVVPVTEVAKVEDDGLPMLDIPVTVHDQVIGAIRARRPQGAEQWTDEDTGLMQALAEQLGLALESARLYQGIQRRAAHERLVGDISDRLQRAPDMETLLQAAAQELNRTLGGSRAYVHLGIESSLRSEADDGQGEEG